MYQNSKILKLFEGPLIFALVIFAASYWFFAYWVAQNGGQVWVPPTSLPHHPYAMRDFDLNFWSSLTYMFTQNPLYTVLTWTMLKTDPAHNGFIGYLILHYLMGSAAIISLYQLSNLLNLNNKLTGIALALFVFNPGFFYEFSVSWYDFLSMCLVSISLLFWAKLILEFNSWNLISTLSALTLLVMYRSLFHPLLFLLPIIISIALWHKQHWVKVLCYSLIPLALTMAPYIKNYIIFDTFNTGIGSFSMAYKTISFEYLSSEDLFKEIQQGHLTPIDLCYSHRMPLTFQGRLFNRDTCFKEILPQFAREKVLEMQFMPQPIILENTSNGFSESYIPNTLEGLVVAKQVVKDSKNFLIHHPLFYLRGVANSLMQYFRSNNTYNYIIALNVRKFPLWFVSPSGEIDLGLQPHIAIGILGSLFYALCFAANLRKKNLYSVVQLIGLCLLLSPIMLGFPHLKGTLGILTIWTFSFSIVLSIIALCRNLFVSSVETNAKLRCIVMTIALVIVYNLVLTTTITGSEQERYRFPVDGLLLILFLFWLSQMLRVFVNDKSHISNFKSQR